MVTECTLLLFYHKYEIILQSLNDKIKYFNRLLKKNYYLTSISVFLGKNLSDPKKRICTINESVWRFKAKRFHVRWSTWKPYRTLLVRGCGWNRPVATFCGFVASSSAFSRHSCRGNDFTKKILERCRLNTYGTSQSQSVKHARHLIWIILYYFIQETLSEVESNKIRSNRLFIKSYLLTVKVIPVASETFVASSVSIIQKHRWKSVSGIAFNLFSEFRSIDRKTTFSP